MNKTRARQIAHDERARQKSARKSPRSPAPVAEHTASVGGVIPFPFLDFGKRRPVTAHKSNVKYGNPRVAGDKAA